MKRRSLSKSDIKELNSKLEFGFKLPPKEKVDIIEGKATIILLNEKPVLVMHEGRWFPALQLIQEKPGLLKKITVDMGAIKFLCSGADVMRPGIVKIGENIAKDEAVLIVDEKYGKGLAVGIALLPAEEMQKEKKGKAIRNLHWVGDWIWEFGKSE